MVNMLKNRNRTSPLRSGFDFQDLWALKLIGEWLLDPDKFTRIQIEFNPTEGQFFLDDIVLSDNAGKYYMYQAKFKEDHMYQWNWNDFLKTRKGKNGKRLPSLFGKWGASFRNIEDRIKKAVFVTNATPSAEISKYLHKQKIDIKELKKDEPELYSQIEKEIGDEDFVNKFFSKFEFDFEKKKIDNVENEIRKFFYNQLFVTETGLNSLYIYIKKNARKSITEELTIKKIRQWCEFDTPEPLQEEFEVPSDFEFFDEVTHQKILKDLHNPKGGIKVIYGKPGVGKSVYLSKLSRILKEQNIVTIKHYYYINPSDESSFDRINSERVIEAIKAQFKSQEYREYLGGLANKNSREIPLREFISTVAQNLSKDKKSFVIIIDGLDHVVREKDVQELKIFLDEVFYPQKGVWIIFGMQPQVKNEQSLRAIFNKCTSENWIEVKGLNRKAVIDIVKQNELKLHLPDNEDTFKDFVDKLFAITKGNPLHLRYVLAQLKNRLNNAIVTKYDCDEIIPYGDSIEEYYTSLWDSLDENTKSFLLVFVSVDFQFTQKQFIECISSFNTSAPDISQHFKQVEHLIAKDSRQKLRIFHDSFKAFLLNQPEWGELKQVIKSNIKSWLENSNYENLKWAELKKLEHKLGNDIPILQIDRKWLIDAIAHPRNPSQIVSQLERCSKAALGKNDFAKALEASYLSDYYKNAQDTDKNAQDTVESANLIWIESIKLNPEFIDKLILKELPSEALSVIAEIANQYGKFYIIDEIIKILIERSGFRKYTVGEIPSITKSLLKVIPYDRKHDVKRVYDYIVKFRTMNISHLLFEYYVQKLLLLEQKTKIYELLTFELNELEKHTILKCCIIHDLKSQTKEFEKLIENNENNSALEQLYLLLQGVKLRNLPDLPDYSGFPPTISEFGEERRLWVDKFHQFFLIGLIYALVNRSEKIEKWINDSPSSWSAQATVSLFNAALEIAKGIRKESEINYEDIFIKFNTLPDLKWPDDRDKLEFKFALKKALVDIFKDIIFIKQFLNDETLIEEKSYNGIISTPFFLQSDVFELVLELEQPILEHKLYRGLVGENIKELATTVNTFPKRSEEYAKLSKMAFIFGEKEKSKELLRKAADNFLGYGYHKDIYLFDILEAVESCAESGIKNQKIETWTKRLIPLIANVEEYTDGDETNHLPSYLADFLSKYNKKLLFKFYFYQADKEELYPAQETFKYVIRSLSFSNDIEIALATTALDKDSLRELKERAKRAEGAKYSLEIIEEYLGKISLEETDDKYTDSYDLKDKKVDYAKVLPDQLKKYLVKLPTKWDYEKYIIGWTKYWLKKEKKEEIYRLIKSVALKNMDIRFVSGDLLDILYPLAYEFDNEEAFKFLCHAQIDDHGWNIYWTDKKKAEKRWCFIKEKYPNRYLEFFKNSINSNFPLSRGVEFFIKFNDLDKATLITEASIKFAEELMADSNLLFPDWAKEDFPSVDETDLLFQRLVWPSPLVRDRAATAIGNLLANSPERVKVYKRLLHWINNWKTESIIAIGLLPIIKAFQICKSSSKTMSFIKIKDIINSIQANSVVIEEILNEIALKTKEKINNLPQYQELKKLPQSYKSNKLFNKYIRTILAPIYINRAQKIETKTHVPFLKLWAYNAEILAQEENIELKPNEDFYGRYQNDKFLIGFSTKVSEIYRSTFLRVLRNFYKKSLILQDLYFEHSFASLPIDLSFWKILPNRIPKWWPSLIDAENSEEEGKISTIQFKEPVESLAKLEIGNKIIIAAEGAIEPSESWKEDPQHTFSLIGFGYKVLGPDLPNPEEISDKILYYPQTLIIPPRAGRPINFLQNSSYDDINSEPFRTRDLLTFPLITRSRRLTISLWQYFRDKNHSFNIVNELRSGLDISIKDKRWFYEDKDKNEIVVFEDWLEGLQERYQFEMPIPHGQYALIDKKFLEHILNENGLRLGYILKTTINVKKHEYGETKAIKQFKFLNVNSIIIY